MLNHGKNYTGNNRFYGFSMDLLDEIARIAKFSYIVDLNPDGAYGVAHPVTGEWNGVVKQLMQHVSICILSLSIPSSLGYEALKKGKSCLFFFKFFHVGIASATY